MPTKSRIKGVMGHQGQVEPRDMDDEMKRTLGLPVSKPKANVFRKKPGQRLVTNGPMGQFAEKINKRKGKKSR